MSMSPTHLAEQIDAITLYQSRQTGSEGVNPITLPNTRKTDSEGSNAIKLPHTLGRLGSEGVNVCCL